MAATAGSPNPWLSALFPTKMSSLEGGAQVCSSGKGSGGLCAVPGVAGQPSLITDGEIEAT